MKEEGLSLAMTADNGQNIPSPGNVARK